MYKNLIYAIAILSCCNACTPHRNEKPNHRYQIKILGAGLAKMKVEILSNGKPEFLMFGDPAQVMFFQKSDSINHIFPIGKKNTAKALDTASIGPNETISITVKLLRNHYISDTAASSVDKPTLHVSLLDNGKEINSTVVPTTKPGNKPATSLDSTATLTFNTPDL